MDYPTDVYGFVIILCDTLGVALVIVMLSVLFYATIESTLWNQETVMGGQPNQPSLDNHALNKPEIQMI